MKTLSSVYLFIYGVTMFLYLLSELDIITGGWYPAGTLAVGDVKEFFQSFMTAFVILFIPLTFLGSNMSNVSLPLTSTELFSISSGIGFAASLLIWGGLIAFTEEMFFGATLLPTIAEIGMSFSFSRNHSLIAAIFGSGVIFSMFHLYVSHSIISLLAYYFLFRILLDIINLYIGSFIFSIFLHSMVNSYIICTIFNTPYYVAVIPSLILFFVFRFLTERVVKV